jgi:hypothetical protein
LVTTPITHTTTAPLLRFIMAKFIRLPGEGRVDS